MIGECMTSAQPGRSLLITTLLFQVCNLALRGTFQNCGQNCIGLERMVVLAPIYDKIVRRMEEKVH